MAIILRAAIALSLPPTKSPNAACIESRVNRIPVKIAQLGLWCRLSSAKRTNCVEVESPVYQQPMPLLERLN